MSGSEKGILTQMYEDILQEETTHFKRQLTSIETAGQWYLRKRQERPLNAIGPSLFAEKRTSMLKRYYG